MCPQRLFFSKLLYLSEYQVTILLEPPLYHATGSLTILCVSPSARTLSPLSQDLIDQESLVKERLSIPDCFNVTNPSDIEVREGRAGSVLRIYSCRAAVFEFPAPAAPAAHEDRQSPGIRHEQTRGAGHDRPGGAGALRG